MEYGAEHDQRVMNLLEAAFKRPSGERRNFVEIACSHDARLLADVVEAVEWEERMCGFLRQPLIGSCEIDRPFRSGQTIAGRFEITREVGEGGMGVVYEAFDRKRRRRICVKTAKVGFRRALPPELEGALRVRHPNICMVNEIHTAQLPGGEVDFLTMEFLEGETLSAYLAAHGKLPVKDAIPVARQLSAALAEAHRSGIVHRDLKPSNIMISLRSDGELHAVITDFGLAGQNSDFDGFGTPRYMAPELWRGEPATPASDIYALGAVLYEMTAGVGPGTMPAPPSTYSPGVGANWDSLVMSCLAPDPADRPEAALLLVRIGRRPPSKTPLTLAGVVLSLAAIGASIPGVRNAVVLRLRAPNVRLVLLPPDGSPETAALAQGVLLEAGERIRQMGGSNTSIVVVLPADAAGQGIRDSDQARQALHATHTLSVTLWSEAAGWRAHGDLLDLNTRERAGEVSGRYTSLNIGNLPDALAGAVSAGLHLTASNTDALQTSNAAVYFSGLYFLRRDRRSFDEAIRQFESAAALDPRSALPLAGLAEAQIQKYQALKDHRWLDEAQRSVSAARGLSPDSIRVHLVAGLWNQIAGRYDAALENYRRVQEREPRNTDALRRIAAVYDLMDMPEKAIAAYRQAIAIDPGYYAAYSELGVLYYFRGKYLDAAQEFRNTIERAPGTVQSYINLGAVMSDLGRDEEAEQALLVSLKIKETPGALNSLGAIRFYQSRFAGAAAFYQRAVAADDRNFIYQLNLGDADRRLGRAGAAAAYRRGMELALDELKQNPRRGYPRAFVGYFAARLGDPARAQDEIGQALQLSPGDGKVIRRAVLTFDALGQVDRAFEVLANATPDLLRELARHPDLAALRRDPRFAQLTGSAATQNGDR
jgi:tetratricopeptide (TPR) repeat protein